MAYIRTCVQNLGEIRRPVRNNCPSSLIIDRYLSCQVREVTLFFNHVGAYFKMNVAP